MRRPRLLALAAGAVATVMLLAGCSGAGEGQGAATNELSISATGVDSLPFMAILQAGIDKGWFTEAGLAVDLFSGGGGGNTLRVVTTGDADMAIAGNTSVLLAARQPTSKLRIVAPWFQVNDFYWIAPGQRRLQGAKLGFSSAGSSTELLAKGLERKVGTTSQAVGPMGDNWTAARAGQVTAGWAMQPFVTEKMAEDGAKVVVSAREVLGDLPADLVAVNSDYAKENPENIRKFFTVATRLNNWVVQEPQDAAKTLAPLLKTTPEIMEKALKSTQELSRAYSLKVDPKALKNLSDLMVAAGQIDQPVDWKTVLDQQFLPESDRATF